MTHQIDADVDFPPEMEDNQEMDLQLIRSPRTSIVYTDYDKNAILWLGIMRIAIGVVVMALQIMSTILHYNDEFDAVDTTGAGIWCGMVFIFGGCLGAISAVERTKCLVISHTVVTGFSMIFAACLLGLCILASFYLVHYIMMSIAMLQFLTDGIVFFLCVKALWKSRVNANEIIR